MSSYVKCLKCGSCINTNTDSKLIYCACGAVGVDGDGTYTRILGNEKNYRIISSNRKEN